MNFYQLERDVIRIVDSLDEQDVPMKAYAQTYARHIVQAVEEGSSYGDSPLNACKTQLLYVLSNLDGAPEEALREIQQLAADNGIDISGAVRETMKHKPKRKKPRMIRAKKHPKKHRMRIGGERSATIEELRRTFMDALANVMKDRNDANVLDQYLISVFIFTIAKRTQMESLLMLADAYVELMHASDADLLTPEGQNLLQFVSLAMAKGIATAPLTYLEKVVKLAREMMSHPDAPGGRGDLPPGAGGHWNPRR